MCLSNIVMGERYSDGRESRRVDIHLVPTCSDGLLDSVGPPRHFVVNFVNTAYERYEIV